MTLEELARALGADLRGDPRHTITAVAGIEEAGPEHLTFVANPKYSALARTTKAGAVIVSPEFPEIAAATLRSANPYLTFAKAVQLFYQEPEYAPGIHPTAVIHPTAKIGRAAHIGAYAVVSEASLSETTPPFCRTSSSTHRPPSEAISSPTLTPSFENIAASATTLCCKTGP